MDDSGTEQSSISDRRDFDITFAFFFGLRNILLIK